MADLFDDKPRATDYPRGMPSVSFSFHLPSGPKWHKAGVTISYEGQYPLEFRSRVTWPENSNFETDVRAGILRAVVADGVPQIGGKFSLDAIQVDPIESSQFAFCVAACEAARAVMNILKKHD
jgi:hypothetical protein